MLAELVVQTSTALVLTGNCLGRVQTIELRVTCEVGRWEQLLGVVDHVLVDHGGRNLVARRTRALNIARRWEWLTRSVAHERLPTVRVVDLSGNPSEVAG